MFIWLGPDIFNATENIVNTPEATFFVQAVLAAGKENKGFF